LAGRAKFGGWLGETRLRQRHTLFLLPAWSVGFPTHTANTPSVARSSRTAFQNFARVFSCDDRREIHLLTMPPKNKWLKQLAMAREARGIVHEEPALFTPSEEESGEEDEELSVGSDDDGSVELVEEAECRPWEWREAAVDVYASLEVSSLPRDSVFSAPRRRSSIRTQKRRRQQQNLLRKSAGRRGTIDAFLQRGSASALHRTTT